MAIQLPNPGLGDGQTGDNEFVMWTKVKDNFSNTTHAASRLVGMARGTVPLSENVFKAFAGTATEFRSSSSVSPDDITTGEIVKITAIKGADGAILSAYPTIFSYRLGSTEEYALQLAWNTAEGKLLQRVRNGPASPWTPWATYYTTANTTVDSNKNIKQSSPVVRVFADHLDKIHEANDLPIKYTRNGVGDYTITGTTGLRENDWQIVIPEDDHRNQLIAFTIEDDNGTIHLKTYKRTFNMTTFMFEPDLSAPLDIPEGRWVDLHFNDLPQEQLDEPAI